MSLIVYDLTLLVLFVIFSAVFLYLKRKNLSKDGPFYLYMTTWGLKLINYIGGKYKKTLKFLSYISVGWGYVLMMGILFLMVQTVYLYLTSPIARIIKAPPIAPLIPYFPKLFGLQSFFPPFYFVYFIVSILIVATVHELSHGIFARRFGIKIKSTGFAFLKYFPALFGAFVEQDEKQMTKTKKFDQMSILSAGVFANTLTAILFYIILFWFFTYTFAASGVAFDTYSYSPIGIANITSVNGVELTNPSYTNVLNLFNDTGFNKIKVGDRNYITTKEILLMQGEGLEEVFLYDDAPAINVDLGDIITEIGGIKIESIEQLGEEIGKYSPGEQIEITTIRGEGELKFMITLGENPLDPEKPWIGVGFYDEMRKGFVGAVLSVLPSYTKPHVYYEPKNDLSLFVKDLLWWIVIINILVALFNMMPLGFLDGGRFFYLTFLGITGKRKFSKKLFDVMTYFLLFLFVVLMVKWAAGFF
ncbi:PDZ domain-containing protein [Candidatus Pacearchaeota archaeon]|nr:PDZ domain-containing protein [Candidatus Pacearchaeota archaeon]